MQFKNRNPHLASVIRKTLTGSMIAGVFGLSACTTTQNDSKNYSSYERLNSVLWMQTSAEYQAASLSAYQQATAMLSKALADPNWTAAPEQTENYQQLPPAIILDIDETVLDNLPFQAQILKDNVPFNQEDWNAWTKLASAKPLPGAKAYLDYAQSQGVTIFYVTNRDASEEADTRKNLQLQKLPLREDIDTVLTKNENGWTSEKSPRRSFVGKNFRIVALVGDDLGDFTPGAKVTPAERLALAIKNADKWGTKWFVIPNPVYGSWESALHNHDYQKSPGEITAQKLDQLQGIENLKP